jgi:ankyrin repeat protein
VYCQLEALRHCLPSSVKGILDELPESLDETYERVLRNINKANREHARRLLQCITVAVRPLYVEELAEVLAVDFDEARRGGIPKSKPDWRWADEHEAVLSTCSSLIAIVDDGYSQVVQFSHFSVKEFLTSDRLGRSSEDISRYHILPSPAHTILAQACLGVLLRLDKHVNIYDADYISLTGYAARHWVEHAQFEGVSPHIQGVMEYFFDANTPHWKAWLRTYDVDDESWFGFTPHPVIPGAVPLYYAALCGFYDLAEHLIVKNPDHVNTRGGRLVTPLVAALRRNHLRVADLLHTHGADLNARGYAGRPPLHQASFEGLVDVVQWLFDHGADVNFRNDYGSVSLHAACDAGQLEACRMLLEHNADVNSRGRWGEVPLHFAVVPGYHTGDQSKIMQLLLDRGADANARDDDGCTPLHTSSWWQRERIGPRQGTIEGSRLLLDYGANMNAENNEGKTPLGLAAENEHHEMAEFLSGLGAR